MALTSIFFISAEHLLSITVGAHGANNCPSIRDPIRAYYISNYPQVFLIYPYSGALGTFAKFLNIIATFTWSFTGMSSTWKRKLSDMSFSDLFVIVVSIGLASKFKQINEDLMEVKGRSVHPAFWSEYRLYYREITGLISLVDNAMSKIILISISNNLFFICVQLLRSLEWVGLTRWSTICEIFLFQWKAYVCTLFLLLGVAGVLDRENACCFTLLSQYKRRIEKTSRSFSIRFPSRLVSRSKAI